MTLLRALRTPVPCLHCTLVGRWLACGVLLATALPACHREAVESPAPVTPVAATAPTADDLLQAMLAAYDQAVAYRDQAYVQLRYLRQGRWEEDRAELAVAWEQPNRLSARVYQTQLVSDGSELFARVLDPSTHDFDGQVVRREAPSRIELPELYQDEILAAFLVAGRAGHPVQLELLFGEQPLAGFLQSDAGRELLDPAAIGSFPCQRIAVTTGEGRFVLWVDAQTHLLRRLELPTEALRQEMEQEIGTLEQVELIIELADAAFERSAPERFEFAAPELAKWVSRFVPLPQPLPSPLIGRRVAGCEFRGPGGEPVSADAWQGKVKVLLWFQNHPACQQGLQQFQQVWRELGEKTQLEFRAVCSEPSEVSDDQIQQLLHQWRVEVPFVRDVRAVGRDILQISGSPALVVLDGDNRLHVFEVGASPNLAGELPALLRRLLAEEDLAAEIIAFFQKEEEDYARRIEAFGQTQTVLLPASSPSRHQLNKQWSYSGLAEAGNVLVVQDGDQPRILVHDGWRSVVELDATGKLVHRHELNLPEKAGVSYLRTATDETGQRFYLGSGIGSPRLFVFDDQWRIVGQAPAAGRVQAGLQDAQFCDLDRDGQLEAAACYWGGEGVDVVSLSGQEKWNRPLTENCLSLAAWQPGDGPESLLVSDSDGALHQVGEQSAEPRHITYPERGIHHLFAARYAPASTAFCGISYTRDGHLEAVGLNDDLEQRWVYSLPGGSFERQIQFVTSGYLAQQPTWLIAAPDGTVHWISADGTQTDSFGSGTALGGIALLNQPEQDLLLLSGDGQVTAWQVAVKSAE